MTPRLVQLPEDRQGPLKHAGDAYLRERMPQNLLFIANYQGFEVVNFVNETHHASGQSRQRARVQTHSCHRTLCLGEDDSVVGVMVMTDLPDLREATDDEIYLLIEADSRAIAHTLLRQIPREAAVELISFRDEHWRWFGGIRGITGVHHYRLFCFSTDMLVPASSLSFEVTGSMDRDAAERVFEPGRELDRFMRALDFQQAGLPYRCFGASEDGEVGALLAIRRSSSEAWEVYAAGHGSGHSLLLATLLTEHGCSLNDDGSVLFWRMPEASVPCHSTVLDAAGMHQVGTEQHLHIRRSWTLPEGSRNGG